MDSQEKFDFQYRTDASGARLGTLTTAHGTVKTPAFIFCGTRAVIRSFPAHLLKELKTQIILSNTYHLLLKPGHDLIDKMGGLQKFTGWNGPMMTDSGGFQIFSLSALSSKSCSEIKGLVQKFSKKSIIHIGSEGALFKSYYDGKKYLLTPELSVEIQCKLGADIAVVFDECTPYSDDKLYVRDSMEVNHKWSKRSHEAFLKHQKKSQVLYGIIHGGTFKDLRKESAMFNNNMPFFGHAIGGSLGKDKKQMYNVVEWSCEHSRKDRPVHLLGVGGLSDIFSCIKFGVDTFDCVHPTRIARHGCALVKRAHRPDDSREYINLNKACYKEDDAPLEPDCECMTCRTYSRSYINFLLSIKDPTVFTILTLHNIYFMNTMMEDIRHSIANGSIKSAEVKWC